jgi:hypothetical protein
VSTMPAAVDGPCSPVFVAGFPRSGTTLLQSLIACHPRIASAPEIHFFSRIYDFGPLWGDLSVDANLRRVVEEMCRLPELLSSDAFDESAVLARAAGTARTYRDLLDAIMTVAAERAGKPRWCEKTPEQRPARIWHLFPEAQVVHVVRDLRDVIGSVGAAPWVHSSARASDIALDWAAFTAAAKHEGLEAGPERFLEIRYEDLARAPRAVMRIVFSFLGEDPDRALIDDPAARRAAIAPGAWWQQRSSDRVEPGQARPWHATLSRFDQARAWAAGGALLTGMGYPPQRRVLAWAGGPLVAGARVRRSWTGWRYSRRARTPERRYQVLADYVQRQMDRAGAAAPPG